MLNTDDGVTKQRKQKTQSWLSGHVRLSVSWHQFEMTVTYLSGNRKKLNAVLIIGILLSLGPWLVIFPTLMFTDNGNDLTTTLMILSFGAIGVTVLVALTSLLLKPKETLKPHSDYELKVNSNKEILKIKKVTDIRFAGNFLTNPTLDMTLEIDNSEAFKLLTGKTIQPLSVKVEKRDTSFLEESPKEWFDDLMHMAWSAS